VSATKRTAMRRQAFVIGLWTISCAIVLVSVLVAPPARGQTFYPWSPREIRPVESAGEVVLTFTSSDPGRVVYYSADGDCFRYPGDPPECGRPQARASEDYGHVKGEWIFTEAGSRTIRVPILDDDLDEANSEAFGVHASRYDDVAEQTTWSVAIVRIEDDDPRSDSGDPSSSPGSSSPAQSSSQARIGTSTPPPQTETRPTEVSRPDRDAASTELRPGPGFELIGSDLVSGRAASARLPEDKGGITKTVFLMLAAVIVSGGGAWIWRRRSSW
jgi:hypothetical protein